MTSTVRPTTAAATGQAPRRLPTAAVVDLVAGVVLLALAVADPFGAPTWLRWTLAGVGDVLLILAAVGLVRARRSGARSRMAGARR
ncbi:hypothetical protein [Egicoccus sp. AB-alg2]|uniref:hypothetical protein n=1 Tax=Egicoccus sp. AB-alg2 TaxID=3242693 RepID=UPI00359DE172